MKGSLKKEGQYYQIRVDMGFDQNNLDAKGKPKRIQKRMNTKCENKKEAEKVLAKVLNDINNNLYAIPNKLTLAEFLRSWIKKHTCEETTRESYVLMIEKHIIDYFGVDFKLQDLTTRHLMQYISSKLDSGRTDKKGGLSPNTIHKHFAVFKKSIKNACANGFINQNPVINVEMPRKEKFVVKKTYTKDEILTLLDCLADSEILPVIFLCAILGLRRSEAIGLKWHNVDLEKNEIHIREARVRFNDKTFDKDKPKNESSIRSFNIPQILGDYLKKLKEKQEANKLIAGNSYNKINYVCCNAKGDPIPPCSATHYFSNAVVKYNLPKIRLHDLRHSAGTILLKMGASLNDVKNFLGHSTITLTANTYTHTEDSSRISNTSFLDAAYVLPNNGP